MAAKYPLEAARTLREHELETAKQELARRVAAVAEAEAQIARARADAQAHTEESQQIAARESALDAAGRGASDMLRAQEYLARRARELEVLRQKVVQAETVRAEADQAASSARGVLAEARAAREAVEQHHERFREEQQRTAETRAEADADDLVASRRVTK